MNNAVMNSSIKDNILKNNFLYRLKYFQLCIGNEISNHQKTITKKTSNCPSSGIIKNPIYSSTAIIGIIINPIKNALYFFKNLTICQK